MPFFNRSEESTPICRCRVLYLGSAVPHVTKDGLQGIQEPLKELYPEQGALGARGIDSWLSVWSNGLLLENVDENRKKVTRFFPIDSLHYCAAVRYVLVPEKSSVSSGTQPRFLPLDSPFARSPNPTHPPLFAAILRRTTGIKVLECHAFICKREMAANALVRCCFHAYADSSYAKQIEGCGTGGSLYGTLCNGQQPSTSSIEKVEGWRKAAQSNVGAAGAGSTLTLNSTLQHTPQENGMASHLELSNSADDVSVYNGDENHKVWAGSSRDVSAERDAIYGDYGNGSTVRSARASRPRQITNAPPPPPPPKEEKPKKTMNKEKPRREKTESSKEDLYYMMNGSLMRSNTPRGISNGFKSSSSVSGGTLIRGYPKGYPSPGSVYSNGTLLRPASTSMNGFHPIQTAPSHPAPLFVVPTTMLPHPQKRLSTGSNPYKNPGLFIPVAPPNCIPVPPPQPIYVPTGRKLSKQHPVPVAIEEPIYMPSARPLSPVASYQPGNFPHEAYLMQQYATTGAESKSKKKKDKLSKKKKNSLAASQASHQNEVGMESGVGMGSIEVEENGSLYNSGIYRKKGHLNERAFSYSIKQEHRSRSYGSLANLKFAPPPVVPNGSIPGMDHPQGPINKEELKKEREIMQMVQDLELSGDELERSEVPQNVYQQNKAKATKVRR